MSAIVAGLAGMFSRSPNKSDVVKSNGVVSKPGTVHPRSDSEALRDNLKASMVSDKLQKENGSVSDMLPGANSVSSEMLQRETSVVSLYESDDDEENSIETELFVRELGPLVPLKEQLERDKEDESLRRWKQQLLGALSMDHIDDHVEPEVKVLSFGLQCRGRPDVLLPLPLSTNARGVTFTLKEGSCFNLKFVFTVRNNIVSGLTCVTRVWKSGLQVDQTRSMLGTFAPQRDPYKHIMEEETTPSGSLARGAYTASNRFVDDDGKVYLELDYSFEIRKDW